MKGLDFFTLMLLVGVEGLEAGVEDGACCLGGCFFGCFCCCG